MTIQAGVARTCITPFWGVELTGWGYYLQRTWLHIHDDLNATSLVLDNGDQRIAIVSLDLMVISAEFTRIVRQMVAAATQIPAESVLVCCTHTHNAPASGGLLGVGEVDPLYETWAAHQAATSAIQAWRRRQPVRLAVATATVDGLTFNRTRESGPIDPTLTSLRADRIDGDPLAVVVGFQAHPTVSTVLRPQGVSRDVPGEVCDIVERELPGCTVLYLQGACGDVNFHREFSAPDRSLEPARAVAEAVLRSLRDADELDGRLDAQSASVRIPTRRWMREEIEQDREEARRRLQDRDITGWRESIGRVMTNRPDDMVRRHGGDEWKAVAAMCRFNLEWTDRMLTDIDRRPEWIDTEVQVLQVGELGIVANASEFFSSLARDVRERSPLPHLMIACYANSRIGYLPDAHDIERKTYAAYQSPKYCNQFPFTGDAGPTMVDAMVEQLAAATGTTAGARLDDH